MKRSFRKITRLKDVRRCLAVRVESTTLSPPPPPTSTSTSTGTSCRALFSSTAIIPAAKDQQPTVTTYRRRKIPTECSSPHRIPLSIVDMHLRNEQLPFCYFFDETLDEKALEASLRMVLKDFPQTGGTLCQSHTAIQCHPDDFVHLSFGTMNSTLEEWQSQPRGHSHQSFSKSSSNNISTNNDSNNHNNLGHPVLLPLFDALFQQHQHEDGNISDNDNDNADQQQQQQQSLVKIRVTYFEGNGTAIAVNFCHALGDTATCVHFVQSWGKQMRQKRYQKVHADRSKACVSGMMTATIADIMGFAPASSITIVRTSNKEKASSIYDSYLPTFLREWLLVDDDNIDGETAASMKAKSTLPIVADQTYAPSIPHEYVRLPFSIQLLDRLKTMGSSSCFHEDNMTGTPRSPSSFVSTNDMLTSYGWLLKRHLSQKNDHNLSMVINLRGRSGVHATLFGNGISHVVAITPETASTTHHHKEEHATNTLDASSAGLLFTDSLCLAAKSIRGALQLGLLQLPDSLSASQMGRSLAAPANSTHSFSTTSWGQFPLYQIRFAEHALSGFHGHPAHPLPEGRTFASVITPSPDGGYWYEMLLPSDQAQQARDRHGEMAAMVDDWKEPTNITDSTTP